MNTDLKCRMFLFHPLYQVYSGEKWKIQETILAISIRCINRFFKYPNHSNYWNSRKRFNDSQQSANKRIVTDSRYQYWSDHARSRLPLEEVAGCCLKGKLFPYFDSLYCSSLFFIAVRITDARQADGGTADRISIPIRFTVCRARGREVQSILPSPHACAHQMNIDSPTWKISCYLFYVGLVKTDKRSGRNWRMQSINQAERQVKIPFN